MAIPKAFISYSHDSQEHKKWVLELAYRLRNNGIDAILDQFELKPGDDVPHFMETHLASADKILMICTDRYVEKANKGVGGVGYEKMIITSNLLKRIDENKVIPVIKQGLEVVVPTFLSTKLYIDFSRVDDYETNYDELVRTIHNSPLFPKPPVGNNPFVPVKQEQLEGDFDFLNQLLKTLVHKYDLGYDICTSYEISIILEVSRVYVEVELRKLSRLGLIKWDGSTKTLRITESGMDYVIENDIMKN